MPAPFLLGLTAVAGISTHVLYFNRGEHHFYGVRYLQVAAAIFATCVAALIRIGGQSFFDAFSTTFAFGGSFLGGLYASLLVYRIAFHPLNKFPGPFGARISSLWYTTQIKEANAHKLLLKLHGQYGDFLRIGSSDLSIIAPDAVATVYGPGSKCGKSLWYDNDYPLSSMHTSRSKALHDRRRRVWSSAFSDKALRGYEDRIRSYGDKLVEQIAAFSGKEVDASKWFNFYSFDVMGDLAFGKPFDMLKEGKEHWAIELLNAGMEPLSMNLSPWLFRILTAIPGAAAGYWKFINYCSKQLNDRWDTKVETPDIIATLIEPFKGKKPSGTELTMLEGDARLIIVAGSDTTAATLTHVFYYLCKDPTQAAKLRDELAPLREANGDFQHQTIADCRHLNAVINEALRLNPPVPSAVHRMTPPEGVEIAGQFVPGNTDVFCPQYVLARNEEIYENAESFHPERWYKDTDMIKHKGAFAPFSIGPFGCIGKPLALLELRTVIAKMIVNFDAAFASGEDGLTFLADTRDHFTLGLAPLKMTFTKRKE